MYIKLKPNLLKNRLFVSNQRLNRSVGQKPELISDKCLHRISLTVCQSLYAGAGPRDKWFLRSGPKSGLPLNINCVDTKPDDPTRPTLVALHGCPGSHLDFIKLIEHFGPEYRVIVPNFPDFSVTDSTNHFWHSAQEKAQFIRDVLRVLRVNRINCLVAHSSAIFPASYLWLKDSRENNIDVRSLCLLSNPGPKWFRKSVLRKTSMLVNISRIAWIRNYLSHIWSLKMSRRMGIRNQIDRYEDLILLLCTYLHSDTETVERRLHQLKDQRLPTLAIFSSNDKLFSEDIFYDLYHILGVNYHDFDVYEEHNNYLIQKSTNENWLKVVNIMSGGHYLFSTHFWLVNQYIERLLTTNK